MKSIRKELTRRLVVGTAILLGATYAILAAAVHFSIVGEFDDALESKAEALVSLTEVQGTKLEIDAYRRFMPEFEEEEDAEYFQFWLHDGTSVLKSDALGDIALPFALSETDETRVGNVRLPGNTRGRMLLVTFSPFEDKEDEDDDEEDLEGSVTDEEFVFELPNAIDPATVRIVLAVARSRGRLDALLASLYLTFAVLGVCMIAGIGVLVRRSLGKGFAPLDALNRQIGGIEPDALSARIDLPSPPEELQAIAAALNGLLDRLQKAFDREQRFTSDVAHELRTPVAELRMACDVGMKCPDDPEGVEEFFGDIREIGLQMERVVSNLLDLSRCDSELVRVTRETCELSSMCSDCWERVPDFLRTEGVRFENRIAGPIPLDTDRGKFQMILQNVIDNASAYSLPGALVSCAVESVATGLTLRVENIAAANMQPEDAARVFDRFWRQDTARTDGRNAGLGLPLAQALAGVLGFRMRVELVDGNRFCMFIDIPVSALG